MFQADNPINYFYRDNVAYIGLLFNTEISEIKIKKDTKIIIINCRGYNLSLNCKGKSTHNQLNEFIIIGSNHLNLCLDRYNIKKITLRRISTLSIVKLPILDKIVLDNCIIEENLNLVIYTDFNIHFINCELSSFNIQLNGHINKAKIKDTNSKFDNICIENYGIIIDNNIIYNFYSNIANIRFINIDIRNYYTYIDIDLTKLSCITVNLLMKCFIKPQFNYKNIIINFPIEYLTSSILTKCERIILNDISTLIKIDSIPNNLLCIYSDNCNDLIKFIYGLPVVLREKNRELFFSNTPLHLIDSDDFINRLKSYSDELDIKDYVIYSLKFKN